MNSRRSWRVLVCVLLVVAASGLWWSLFGRGDQAAARADLSQSVPYKVLNDDNGDAISIGLDAKVSEQQLRATLASAANERQDDRARDYVGLYLWVNAYLLSDGRQSNITAGRLRRFVPVRKPGGKKKTDS